MKDLKEKILNFAEVIDSLRFVPRTILLAYGYLIWDIVNWFKDIDAPTMEHTALVTVIVGASAAIIGLYQNSGRKW